jgi:hypothetical protein
VLGQHLWFLEPYVPVRRLQLLINHETVQV